MCCRGNVLMMAKERDTSSGSLSPRANQLAQRACQHILSDIIGARPFDDDGVGIERDLKLIRRHLCARTHGSAPQLEGDGEGLAHIGTGGGQLEDSKVDGVDDNARAAELPETGRPVPGTSAARPRIAVRGRCRLRGQSGRRPPAARGSSLRRGPVRARAGPTCGPGRS